MALNFPNSPTNGQLYTDTMSGNSWTWDSANTCWKSTSTYIQTITVASSAPGTPAVGQLWWNRDYGRLLVYYNDGDTSQWVDASPSDYTSGLAYAQANTVFNQSNTVYGVANAAFSLANTHLANTSGVTFAGDLIITGNTTIKKKTIVNYTPAITDNAAMYIASANTQGGNGYADFLKIQNISYPAVTNPNKSFRLTPTGTFEIINNAYTAAILGLDDSGNFSVAGSISSSSRGITRASMPVGSIVQTQYVSSGTRTSVDSTSFVEPSSAYRVSITPSSSSSIIKLHYYMMLNPGGSYATNTIFTVRAFRILNGVTTYSLISTGNTNGSRNVIAGATFRPWGYDLNDAFPLNLCVLDNPGTTSTCTYGFEYKREAGGTGVMYFGYSSGDSSLWGFDTDIVIVAEEIAQ